MGYTKSSSGTDLPADLVVAMASLLGVPLTAEELPGLTAAVRDQLDSLGAFGGLDLEDEMPAIEFDCRWRTGDDQPG
jgi:hypothetical protein